MSIFTKLRKTEETELNQISDEFLETIKIDNGKVHHLAYHQQRYESVLDYFGIKNTREELSNLLEVPEDGLYRCRFVYRITKNTHSIKIEYLPYEKKEIRSLRLVFDDKVHYEMKSTNREYLQRLYSMRKSCDDILIVKNSLITDTTIANIAFYDQNRWITPKQPLLKGTTRARLLDEGQLLEKDIRVEDIKQFSKIALMNAMIGFDPLQECQILI